MVIPDSQGEVVLRAIVDAIGHLHLVQSSRATRVENRAPCASANPYLVYAAAFAAGLDGIENKIDPGEPAVGDIYGAEPGTYELIQF